MGKKKARKINQSGKGQKRKMQASSSKVIENATTTNRSSLTFPAVSSCRVVVQRQSNETLNKLTSLPKVMVEDIGRRLKGRNSVNICEVEDLLNGNGNDAGEEGGNTNGDDDDDDEDEDEDAIREGSECEIKVSSGEESVMEIDDDDTSVILVSEHSEPCESLEKCADLWEEDGSIFEGSCSNSKMEETTRPESPEVITLDDEPSTSVGVEQVPNEKELCESEMELNYFEVASREGIHFTCQQSKHCRGRMGPFSGPGRRGMKRRLTKLSSPFRSGSFIVERSKAHSTRSTPQEPNENEDLLETNTEKTFESEVSETTGDNAQCSNDLNPCVELESDVAIPSMKQSSKKRGWNLKKLRRGRHRISKTAKDHKSELPDCNQNLVVPIDSQQSLANMDLCSGRRTRSSCGIPSASSDLHSHSTNLANEQTSAADSSCSAVEHAPPINSCGMVAGVQQKDSTNKSSEVHHRDLGSKKVARETSNRFEIKQNDRKAVCSPKEEVSIAKECFSEGRSHQPLAISRPKRQISRPRLLEAFVTPTIRATKIVKRPLESLSFVQKNPVLNPKPHIPPVASEPAPAEQQDLVSILKPIITESPKEDAKSSPTMPKIKGKKKSKVPAPRKKTNRYAPRNRNYDYMDISRTNVQMVSRSRSTPILCVNDDLQIGMFYLIAQEGNRMQLMRFNGSTMEPFDTNWADTLRTSAESSLATEEEEQHDISDKKGAETETFFDSSTATNFTVAA